jgi:galactosylceramidase
MRTSDPASADFSRGFAWWLLTEAKRRNPIIETYALAESWPRWVHGNAPATTGPLDAPELSARYLTEWVCGARDSHNLTIDWVGMWNEHWEADEVMFAFVKELRSQLDAAGLQHTRIIGPGACATCPRESDSGSPPSLTFSLFARDSQTSLSP